MPVIVNVNAGFDLKPIRAAARRSCLFCRGTTLFDTPNNPHNNNIVLSTSRILICEPDIDGSMGPGWAYPADREPNPTNN
jgi:hypothetical protein